MEEPSRVSKQPKPKPHLKRTLQILTVGFIVFAGALYIGYRHTALNADLIEAVQTGSASEVKTLLDKGADPNVRAQPDGHNFDMLEWLKNPLRGGQRDEEKLLPTALIIAAGNRHGYECLKALVEHGADIHARSPFGDNALIIAAVGGDVESVKYLHEKGLSVSSDPASRRTPVGAAVESKNPEVVRYLISVGADVNANNGAPSTRPLYIAKELHRQDIVNILIKAGAK